MKSSNSTYKNIAGHNNDPLLEKAVLKDRIKKTRLTRPGNNFILETWAPEDDQLTVNYTFSETTFGEMLIAATKKGISYIGFTNQGRANALADCRKRFPKNVLAEQRSPWQQAAIKKINDPGSDLPVRLHLRGTAFQLKIWEKLMQIPFGGLTTYGQLGEGINNARAIGAAVGANPVSYLLACHRVVRADGNYEGYHWGNDVKKHLLQYEAAAVGKSGIQ